MKSAVFISVCAFLLLIPLYLCGDEILLKNGRVIEGLITGENEDALVVDVEMGRLTLRKVDIERSEKKGAAENLALAARMHFTKGEWESGFDQLEKALDEGLSKTEMLGTLTKSRDAIRVQIVNLKQQHRDTLIRLINEVVDSASIEPVDTFWLAYLLGELGEIATALERCATLPPEFFETRAEEKSLLEACVRKRIKELAEKQEIDKALQLVERVQELGIAIAPSTKALLLIKKGAEERNSGWFARALRTYGIDLYPLAPAIAQNRLLLTMDVFIKEAETKEDFEAAIDLITPYRKAPWTRQVDQKLAETHELYGNLLLNTGKIDEAQQAFIQLEQYGCDQTERYLAVCEYERRLNECAGEDYKAFYDLGLFCLEQELLDEAEEMFGRAKEEEIFAQNAGKHIKIIQEKKALHELKKIMKVFEEKSYFETLDLLSDYAARFPNSDLKYEAKEIADVARQRIEDEQWRRNHRAQVLYQQAERSLMTEDIETCLVKLEEIIRKYRTSAVLEKALTLYKIASRKAQIAHLEGKTDSLYYYKVVHPPVRGTGKADALRREIEKIISETESL